MNIIIIVSVCRVANTPFSYIATRSVFSYKERIEQLKESIQSARQIPNSYVVLAECSDLDKADEDDLKVLVNLYLNMKDTWVNECVISSYKGWGEAAQIAYTLSQIQAHVQDTGSDLNNKKINSIYKLSGRYTFSYNAELFDNNQVVCKKILNDANNVCTVFYKVPFSRINNFYQFLMENIEKCRLGIEGIENCFARFVRSENTLYVDNVGYRGYVSVCGSLAMG